MFAQLVLTMALVGQCGGSGVFSGRVGGYGNDCGSYMQSYDDGCGSYMQSYDDGCGEPDDGCGNGGDDVDYPAESSPLRTSSTSLVGDSVLCRYRNTGQVTSKSYAKARVYDGERVGLITVPIINNYMPSCVFNKRNGMITSMTCDYNRKIPYHGGMIGYGKKTASVMAKESISDEVIKIPNAPVPSQETYPIPNVSDDPPEATPLPQQ